MSKQIYVQAQADHIESLFKGTPLSAVEELVWNALDADAFVGKDTGELATISRKKNKISAVIMEKLSKEKLRMRTCRI